MGAKVQAKSFNSHNPFFFIISVLIIISAIVCTFHICLASVQADRKQTERIARRFYFAGLHEMHELHNAKALYYFEKALEGFKESGSPLYEAQTLAQMGEVYSAQGKTAKALTHYDMALKMFQRLGDRAGEFNTLGSLGHFYFLLGELDKALKHYKRAMAIALSEGYRRQLAACFSAVGDIYRAKGEQTKALNYYGEAVKLVWSTDYRQDVADALDKMGRIYFDQGELDKAIDHWEKAKGVYEKERGGIYRDTIEKIQRNLVKARKIKMEKAKK